MAFVVAAMPEVLVAVGASVLGVGWGGGAGGGVNVRHRMTIPASIHTTATTILAVGRYEKVIGDLLCFQCFGMLRHSAV